MFVIIAFAFTCSAIWTAFKQIELLRNLESCKGSLAIIFFEILCLLCSISRIILRIVSTTFKGNFPTDVSPLNIRASAPSITEFATSLTSARVADGDKVMLSSI